MVHILSLIFVLSLTWWLLSGYLIALIIGLGFFSVLFVVWIAFKMDSLDHETHPISMAASGALYFPWLIVEILKANIDVVLTILVGGKRVDPRLLKVIAGQKSELGRVVYANSITLTPGTISIDLDGSNIGVHSLSNKGANGVKAGDMDRKITSAEANPYV